MKFVLYFKRPSKTAISFLLATSDGLRNVPDGEKPLWRDFCIRRLQTTGLTSFLSKIHGEKELASERQMFLLAHRPSSGDERGETFAVRRLKKNASRTVALKL